MQRTLDRWARATLAGPMMLLLVLFGCAAPEGQEQPPPPAATEGMEATEATNDEVPASGEPDARLEEAILLAAPDYTRETVDLGGVEARYLQGRFDLDGDGAAEVLVYPLGSIFCGSGGCNLMLFADDGDAYRLIAAFPITQTPVLVAETTNNGWRDLIRSESGGGASASWVRHIWDGEGYVESERLPAEPVPEGTVVIPDDFAFDDGLPLAPSP